jgi:hypothetical protein
MFYLNLKENVIFYKNGFGQKKIFKVCYLFREENENASKTVFGLLNLVKIREIGTTFSKKSQYLVYNPESVLGRPSIFR